MDTNRDKRAALEAALNGDASALKRIQARMGRRYTEEEIEQRRVYLTTLWGHEATRTETITFFGRYDKSMVPNVTFFELPSGMPLYF